MTEGKAWWEEGGSGASSFMSVSDGDSRKFIRYPEPQVTMLRMKFSFFKIYTPQIRISSSCTECDERTGQLLYYRLNAETLFNVCSLS